MDLDAGKYYYDMQIYDADSKMVTKLYGDFIVLQDVTDFLMTIEKNYDYMLSSKTGIAEVLKENPTFV
jgi:hypothetical protein